MGEFAAIWEVILIWVQIFSVIFAILSAIGTMALLSIAASMYDIAKAYRGYRDPV